MGPLLIGVLVVLAVLLLAFLWVVGTYNGLVRLRNQVKNAWAQIDVQLKRRHDLIPNLVETVKGYAAHERGTLDAVVAARSKATSAQTVSDRIQSEGELSQALGRLMVVVEAYPDLKANQNFLALQEELTSTENKISFSRQFYNDSAMQYNTRIESFPANVIAGSFAFRPSALFELLDREERAPVAVKF
jgi:LemA protein